jgi:deoxyribonuclease V
LDDEQLPGLGCHLYSALRGKTPVIGVAKSNFATLNKLKIPLLRENSTNPLYITAVGVSLQAAGQYITDMAGPYRIPTLLKTLDTETKAV